MINLIIVYADNTWDKSPAFIDKDRCLTEYILPEFKEKYSAFSEEVIEEIKRFLVFFHMRRYIN